MDIAANKARRPVNDSSGRSQAFPCRELIAGIAIPARPSRVDFLAEVFENESRAAAGGLTELDYRVELGLIPGAAIFVVDEICGEISKRCQCLGIVLLESDGDSRGLGYLGVLTAQKVGLNAFVFDSVEQCACCGRAITAGASGLLVIRLYRTRKVIVNYEPHILLVDTESECVRGNDRLE